MYDGAQVHDRALFNTKNTDLFWISINKVSLWYRCELACGLDGEHKYLVSICDMNTQETAGRQRSAGKSPPQKCRGQLGDRFCHFAINLFQRLFLGLSPQTSYKKRHDCCYWKWFMWGERQKSNRQNRFMRNQVMGITPAPIKTKLGGPFYN